MMEWYYAPFLLLLLYFIYKKISSLTSQGNLPPGPKGIPLFGYLPFFKRNAFIELRDIGKKYGTSLFTIQLGLKRVIVLNDWKSVKEALVNQTDNFTGRPKTIIFNEIRERTDITGSDGALWKERRHFTMKTMRQLGFRDVFMEAIIMEEVEKMSERLKVNFDRKIVNMDDIFMNHLLNIIWGVSTGKKFEENDERVSEFAHILKITSVQNSSSNTLEFLPFMKYMPKYNKDFRDFVRLTKKVYQYIEDEIDEHIKSYDENNIRDFIDAYYQEMDRRKKNNIKPEMFERKYLRGIMYNFFNGGVDTGNNTITWAMLYIASWPKIQKKMQEEMDRVIGRSRLPTWADHVNLPYTEAVLLEVQRYATIAPLGFPHCCYTTTKVCGFTVPKDTHVLANIWAVHNDPDYWGDPENFRPERFLNDKGEIEKPEYLIPFSTGRRICVGEALARMELYLFVTSVLHQFTFELVTGEPLPSFQPIVGLTLRPHAFNCFIKYRN